jgi:hypothetical protein
MLDFSRNQSPRLQVIQSVERRQFPRHILGRPRLLAELLQGRLELLLRLRPRLLQRLGPLLHRGLNPRHLPRRVNRCRQHSGRGDDHHQCGGPEKRRGSSHESLLPYLGPKHRSKSFAPATVPTPDFPLPPLPGFPSFPVP